MRKIPFLILILFSDFARADNGLAPEITDLNAKDISFELEKKLAYLKSPFINSSPRDKGDGLLVGSLENGNNNKNSILLYAQELAKTSNTIKNGQTDSLLIAHKGKLIFESYFRRGRANFPHYQMSITKSYTTMALGRAMQLGYLNMEDLNKPVISFLKRLDPSKLVKGASSITLHEAMQMRSGIRLPEKRISQLIKKPERLIGQGQIQAYLQFSSAIPSFPRDYKYQASDPSITMQVLEAIVPGTAKDFIRDKLLKPMQITNYHWQDDISELPKSAAGSSFLSRDMVKMGLLVLKNGKWDGKQHIPSSFIKQATSPLVQANNENNYGYFWWSQNREIEGTKYPVIQGRGAGGQFIFIFPSIELVVVGTAHNKGMGTMLKELPERLVPAFTEG